MKKLIILIALSVALFSCNSRKVATQIVKNTDQVNWTGLKVVSISSLDTSVKVSQTHSATVDSSSYEIDITPDTTIVTVGKNGFIGKASKITIKGKGDVKKVVDQLNKKFTNVAMNKQEKDSSATDRKITQSSKNKQSDSTPSIYPWIAIIVVVIIILVAIYFYLRSMGVFTVGDIAKKIK